MALALFLKKNLTTPFSCLSKYVVSGFQPSSSIVQKSLSPNLNPEMALALFLEKNLTIPFRCVSKYVVSGFQPSSSIVQKPLSPTLNPVFGLKPLSPTLNPLFGLKPLSPTLNPVFGLKPISRVFINCSFSTESTCSSEVFESFDLKTLDSDSYLIKMARIRNMFPFVDGKTDMRRVFLPTDKGFRPFLFLEACFDDMGHFLLVVALEEASLLGVKLGEQLLVFKGHHHFRKEAIAGVKHIDYVDFGFNPDTFLPFRKEMLEAALKVVNEGFLLHDSHLYVRNVSLIFNVLFRGVIFPGLKTFIADTLESNYGGTYILPEYLNEVLKSWDDVSRWYLAGAKGAIKVDTKIVKVHNVTSTLSLVKGVLPSPQTSSEGKWEDTSGLKAVHKAAKIAYRKELQLPEHLRTLERPEKKKKKN